MRLPLRGAISAYEACAADVYRAFGGSWFIGSVLTVFYLVAFSSGLLMGALIYELLLGPFGRPLGSPINRAVHVAALLLLFYAASSLMCIVARAAVQGITYLCYEMRGDVLFYLLIVATVVAAALLITSAVLPPIVSDQTLDAVAGLSVIGVLESRIHRSLDKDAPFHRAIERFGVITSQPVLGGLHHQYCRI